MIKYRSFKAAPHARYMRVMQWASRRYCGSLSRVRIEAAVNAITGTAPENPSRLALIEDAASHACFGTIRLYLPPSTK